MTAQDYQDAYAKGQLPSQIASKTGASQSSGGNFLSNLLLPFIQSAKNIGGAAYEIPREIGMVMNEGKVNNDIKKMQQTGTALKANPSAANMQATHNAGDQAQTDTNNLMGWKQAQDPFLNNQDMQQINNNPGGYVGNQVKNSIGMASYGIPFGKTIEAAQALNPLLRFGINTATKAVIPGAVSGGMFATADPNANVGSIANGTVGGAIGGEVGNLLGGVMKGATGMMPKVGKMIGDKEDQFYRGQYNVNPSVSADVNLPAATQALEQRHGIGNADQAVDLARQLVGYQRNADGSFGKANLLTDLKNRAIAPLAGVDLGGINDLINKEIGPGSRATFIPQAIKNGITAHIRNVMGFVNDGTQITETNPIKLSQAIGDLGDEAHRYYMHNDPASQQAGRAYSAIKNALEERLYNGYANPDTGRVWQGANNTFLKSIKTPQVIEQLNSMHSGLGDYFDKNVHSVRDLQHMSSPFVAVDKAMQKADDVKKHQTLNTFQVASALGLGAIHPALGATALIARPALNSNVAQTAMGKSAGYMSRKMQNTPQVGSLLQQLLANSGSKIGAASANTN